MMMMTMIMAMVIRMTMMIIMLIAAVTMLGMLTNIIITLKFQFQVNKRFVQNRSHRSLFQENLLAHIFLQLLR